MSATDDPVLLRFRAALDAAYGDRVEQVVLFDSRARGHRRLDSDHEAALPEDAHRGRVSSATEVIREGADP